MSDIVVRNGEFENSDSFDHLNFIYQASAFMAGRCNLLSAYFGELAKSIAKKNIIKFETNLRRQFCRECSIILIPEVTCDLNVRINNQTIDDDGAIGGCRKTRRKRLRKLRKRRKKELAISTTLTKGPGVEDLDANSIIQITCRHCHNLQEFPLKSERTAWLDRLESISEIHFDDQSTNRNNNNKNSDCTQDKSQ